MISHSLEGRVALVTGAGGGLGSAISEALMEAGASVVLCERNRERLQPLSENIRSKSEKSLVVEADVSDKRSVEAMMDRVTDKLGGVDILVNNAAIYPARSWLEISEEEWDGVLAVNLKGYFLCARSCFSHMKERQRGRIINVASLTFFVGFENLLHYVSSKGGVLGFTRTLARETGPEGVTVNAVSPGAFPTEAESIHPDPEAYNQWVLDQQSIKRRGTPEDVGSLVAFLASDAASFITGQTIEIDGGWVMH